MHTLGKFEIIERLGAGGMGVVYRARDVELGRQVALKVLPEEVQAVPNRRVRFLHEARAVAALNHPAIATLYEFGEADDDNGERRLFLAMELVEGDDLQAMMASGPMTAARALTIGRQLAAGLEAAHRRGIIHRDLKPGNVRITAGGQVKILDFGLAKLAAPSSPDLPHDASLTREGLPMGTAPYMAPEQARGETVDARADLFSLGVILFEMLTGKRPFEARRFGEYLLALERGPSRSLADELPEVDPRLAALVDRLLERKRTTRFASASDVVELLARLEAEHGSFTGALTSVQPPSSPPARQRRRRTVVLASIATLAVLTVLAVLVVRPRPGQSSATKSHRLAVVPFENLTGDSDLDFAARGLSAALSGDLTSLRELAVVAPSITAAYSGQVDRHRRLAAEQGVEAILEGRIQREESTLRVAVDYIDASDGSLLWSLAFEDSISALFRLQSTVAAGVGSRLREILSPSSLDRLERQPTQSNDAYESYLRGLQFLEQSSQRSEFEVAIYYFQRAVEADPKFAAAHAQLATALVGHAEASRDVQRLERGLQAAKVALELDPELLSARLALVRGYRQAGRLEEARELLSDLVTRDPALVDIELDPVDLLLERGENEWAQGKHAEATRTFLQATEIAPSSWRAWNRLGIDSLRHRRFDEARNHLSRAWALAPPGQAKPVTNLIALELRLGDPRAAVDIVESFAGPITDALLASNAGTAYYGLGNLELAERYYRLGKQLRPAHEALYGNLGDVLRKLGRAAEARLEYEAALTLVEQRGTAFPEAPDVEAARVFFLAKAERCDEALEADRSRRQESVVEPSHLVRLAKAAALCQRTDEALGYARSAAEAGASLGELRSAEELEALHALPEFRRLVGPDESASNSPL
jgi:eukaryotic-like serine/threonine-protein kinase